MIDVRRVKPVADQCRLVFYGFMHNGVQFVIGHDFKDIDHQLISRDQVLVVLSWIRGAPQPILRASADLSKIRRLHCLFTRLEGRITTPAKVQSERLLS